MQARPALWSLALAFLVAPAVPAALYAAWIWSDTPSQASYFSHLRMVAITGAYHAAFVLGLPVLLILYGRVAPTALRVSLVGGAVAGGPWLLLIPFSLAEGSASASHIGGYLLEAILPAFLLGLVGGVVFYIVGIASSGRSGLKRLPQSG